MTEQKIIGKGTWIDKLAFELIEREKQLGRDIDGIIKVESGLGASGIPHIGSLGDAVRAYGVKLALENLGYKSELIAYSDDLDGLRKIPEGLDVKEENMGRRVSAIEDPYGKCHDSYGSHMSSMLLEGLDKLGIKYVHRTAHDTYKNGILKDQIHKILVNSKKIGDEIEKLTGQTKFKNVLPYFPVCQNCDKLYTTESFEYIEKEKKIRYRCKDSEIGSNIIKGCGHEGESDITKDLGKLAWKVEFAARWQAFDIRFEAYGKDIMDSVKVNDWVSDQILEFPHPHHVKYEMFLDEKGEKISKSKGNGITIEQWIKYASPESLSLYMYQNPKRAKKLYADVVPKAVDEYLTCIDKFSEQDDKQKLLNPVWHVHNGNPPKEKSIMPFSVLLNLVGTSNATDKEVLWKFIKKYKKDIKVSDHPILDSLVTYALKYFADIVKPKKKYRKPNEKEKKALQDLVKRLRDCKDQMDPEAIQTIVYSVGKDNGYQENLREWFKAIYEIIFGDQDGPRVGFFISFFGIKESMELINKYIK